MTTVSGYDQNSFREKPASFQLAEDWRSASGRGVSVAIIDSGIDTTHRELQGKVFASVEARIDNKKVIFEPSTSVPSLFPPEIGGR